MIRHPLRSPQYATLLKLVLQEWRSFQGHSTWILPDEAQLRLMKSLGIAHLGIKVGHVPSSDGMEDDEMLATFIVCFESRFKTNSNVVVHAVCPDVLVDATPRGLSEMSGKSLNSYCMKQYAMLQMQLHCTRRIRHMKPHREQGQTLCRSRPARDSRSYNSNACSCSSHGISKLGAQCTSSSLPATAIL